MQNLFFFIFIFFGVASISAKANDKCGIVEKITTKSRIIEVVLDSSKEIHFRVPSKATSDIMFKVKIDLARDSMNFGHTICVLGSGKFAEIELKSIN